VKVVHTKKKNDPLVERFSSRNISFVILEK